MSHDNDDGYKVGYAKPPKATQFKKGQASRNPRGRPPAPKTEAEAVFKIMNELHEVHHHGKRRKMTAYEIMIRAVLAGAMKGDIRAVARLMKELNRLGITQATPHPTHVHVTTSYVEPDRVERSGEGYRKYRALKDGDA